jgi:hypothetical protein
MYAGASSVRPGTLDRSVHLQGIAQRPGRNRSDQQRLKAKSNVRNRNGARACLSCGRKTETLAERRTAGFPALMTVVVVVVVLVLVAVDNGTASLLD